MSGSEPGTFTVGIHAYSQDGTIQPPVTVTGIGGPGSVSTFNIDLATAPGSSSTVSRTTNSAGLTADLENAIKAGLIKKPSGLVLTLLVQIATEALDGNRCLEARGILDLFIAAVKGDSGRGVDPTAAQVLEEDAMSLKGSCSLK